MNRSMLRRGAAAPLITSAATLLLLALSCLAEERAKAIYHQAPKPLASSAAISDWTRFLGPSHNALSPETKLLKDWPQDGLRKVWEVEKGKGWA